MSSLGSVQQISGIAQLANKKTSVKSVKHLLALTAASTMPLRKTSLT